ncbi:hypothetical protein [Campylobacter portucalensis]|uniref:hypothetical protein n=1 Tax=Campylobacter portucalensis TaxID=2608384 RepID=UPI0012B1AB32|nr:hypothetical protein [Campylobacter portucalensis]
MKTSKQLLQDIKDRFTTILNAQNLAITNDKSLLNYMLEESNFKDKYKNRFLFKKQMF